MVAWKNPGEHIPRSVEARTAWPVGISQMHRKPWSDGEGGTVTTTTPARSMEECPKRGNGGIITRMEMNEDHMLGNKSNKKKTSDRKESVLSTVVKSPTAVTSQVSPV